MSAPTRALWIAAGIALALAVVLWPRRAPESTVPAPASAPLRMPPPVRPDAGASRAARPAAADAATAPLAAEAARETELVEAAHAALAQDPARTLALIEAADRRFGEANETRRALEIEALVKLERIGLSHAKAEHFYRAFPGSAAARRIEQLTGYHPRPWGPRDAPEE